MFNKSFISIYFLNEEVVLLELTSDKRKVKKFISYPLPGGLIENYKVVDKRKLAQVIKEAWKKGGFKEKSVGVIVPEFSTFSKIFSIPKVSLSELDEAVKWQAQEYLPESLEKLIMDWKIIESNDKGHEVLVVSVLREVLLSYVEACELAELYLFVVETPSLCLTRLEKDKNTKLNIYVTDHETLLTLISGERILGTSVVQTVDGNEIISTSKKMLNHYKNFKTNKIMIGGLGATSELVKKVGDNLKISTVLVTIDIKGLPPESIQKYIVPALMQYGNHDEPSDPSTLNLLPVELVGKYKNAKKRVQAWSITLTITLFTWISFLLTLSAWLFVSQQTTSLESVNSANYKIIAEKKKTADELMRINKITDKVLEIEENSLSSITALNDIYRAKPSGITINSYKISFDEDIIGLEGVSASRDVLIQFRKNLEMNEKISGVDIPISSFEQEANLSFTLTLNYCLPKTKTSVKVVK